MSSLLEHKQRTKSLPFQVGDRFGDRVVVKRSDQTRNGAIMWVMRCKCGAESHVLTFRVAKNTSCRSCSRLKPERKSLLQRQNVDRYGERPLSKKHPLYQTWRTMLRRCSDPRRDDFHKYGGRGIAVHERWLDFAAFVADMGPKPSSQHSIEREDNSRGYEPGNCVWATGIEQCRNTRRNVFLEHNSERLIVSEWGRRKGLRPGLILNRINVLGWDVDKALTTPARAMRQRKKPHAA